MALCAVVVAVPLAFDPGGFFAFLPMKSALAAGLTAGALGLLIAGRRTVVVSKPLIAWGVLLAVLAVASLTGIGGVTSWIGYPGRYLGMTAWVVFAGAFVLGASLREERDRHFVAQAVSAAAIVVSAYAILQAVGLDPLDWREGTDISRTRSTLGNAAFLGAYLSMVLPLSGRLALVRDLSGRVRALHAAAAGSAAVAVLTTETRGAWLGVVAGVLLVVGLEHRRLRTTPRQAAVALSAGAVLVVLLATVSPFASRIQSIADIDEMTSRGRLTTWERTTELIAERPVLGWGLETTAFAFPRVIDADYEQTVGRDTVPDRAHNVFLDVATWAGGLGVAAFAGLLIAIAWVVARAGERSPLTVGLAGACLAYVVQLQFSFPVADVDTVFWVLAGLLVAGVGAGAARTVSVPRQWAALPLAIGLAFLAWGAADVVADRSLRRALDLEAAGDLDRAQQWADRSRDMAVGRVQYMDAAARLHQRVGQLSRDDADFERGLDALDAGRRIVPRDLELALTRADILLAWGESTGGTAHIEDAVAAYQRVLARDRFSSRAHLRLGVAYVQLGRDADAESEWTTAARLAPRSSAPLVNLGRLYAQQDRTAEALRVTQKALALDPGNPSAAALLKELEG